jgi:UDP:flavonoid glycosyltransferase YjiC (YdhE family)
VRKNILLVRRKRFFGSCITHAGLNTTLESLTHGVPLVAIPVTNDQPGVAARIAHSHTGLFVPLLELTVPKLRTLIDEVLLDPRYRRNAQVMSARITKEDNVLKAAQLIEQRLAKVIVGPQPSNRRWKLAHKAGIRAIAKLQ